MANVEPRTHFDVSRSRILTFGQAFALFEVPRGRYTGCSWIFVHFGLQELERLDTSPFALGESERLWLVENVSGFENLIHLPCAP